MKGGARVRRVGPGGRGIDGLSSRELLDRARSEMGPSRAERAALRRGVLTAVSAGALAAAAGSAQASVGAGASTTSAIAHGVAGAKSAAALGASTAAGATATTLTSAVTLKWTLAAVIATAAVAGTGVIGVNAWRRPERVHEVSAHTASLHIASSNSVQHARAQSFAGTHDTTPVLEMPTATLAAPRVPQLQPTPPQSNLARTARASLLRAPAHDIEASPQLAAPEIDPALPTAENDLAEETSLLRAAHTALSAGDSSLALSILDQHSLRFPSGTLMEERLALHARVLCSSGQTERGREEATRFAENHARSPQVARILRACGIGN